MELYITDLDGTLLNNNKEVSTFSKNIINNLIDRGLKFTIATARTPGTIIDILEGLKINLPVVLMNGVILYDIKNKNYLSFKKIKNSSVEKIIEVSKFYKKNLFIYSIENNKLVVYYKHLKLNFDEEYYKERATSKYKDFVNVENYEKIAKKGNVVNLVMMDKLEVIKEIYEKIKNIEGIYVNYCEDIYTKGCYFLEIHSDLASKANGIKELSENISHEKLICFGDNTNDISMFKLADEAYAMDNAVDSLKIFATDIIESNENDGVAKFIANNFKL